MYMVPVIGPGEARRRKRRELSEEQKQEIVEAFNFDTDKDQAMDYHELKTAEAFFTESGITMIITPRPCIVVQHVKPPSVNLLYNYSYTLY